MARYPLNLPDSLKQEAQQLADREGISLNQLILWAVAERVASSRSGVDDPDYPQITYRRGAAGQPVPVLRGHRIRVIALYVASDRWGMSSTEIAEQYGLTQAEVRAALAFACAHRQELESAIAAEEELAEAAGQ